MSRSCKITGSSLRNQLFRTILHENLICSVITKIWKKACKKLRKTCVDSALTLMQKVKWFASKQTEKKMLLMKGREIFVNPRLGEITLEIWWFYSVKPDALIPIRLYVIYCQMHLLDNLFKWFRKYLKKFVNST